MIHPFINGGGPSRLMAALAALLEAAAVASEAKAGFLRIFDANGRPDLLVHRGLPHLRGCQIELLLRVAHTVHLASSSAERIVIEDVARCPAWFGTNARQLFLESGIRSLQTTFIREDRGRLIGMLSTLHDSERPALLDAMTLRVIDAVAAVVPPLLVVPAVAGQRDVSGERPRVVDVSAAPVGPVSGCALHGQGEPCLPVFLDEAPVALAVFDREMRYLAASRCWREAFDLGNTELIGRSQYEVLPDTSAECMAMHRDALSGSPVSCEAYRLITPDGRVRWLRWQIVPWRNSAREVGGILICAEDITASRSVTDALRTIERQLRRAHEAANAGAWEWDVRTNGHQWGDETYRLLGLRPGVAVPSLASWVGSIHPDDRAWALARAKDCLGRQAPLDLECRVLSSGGPARWLWVRGLPEFDESGRLARYTGIAMDISERKRFEEASARHDERMQALARQQVAVETAATFADKLSQPLASVVAYSELAMLGVVDNRIPLDRILSAIRGTHDQAARAGRVLQELIDNLQRDDLQVTAIDLGSLIREVVDAVRKTARQGYRATLDIQAGLPPVLADRLRTERVLRSLLRNGLEAMEEAGTATQSFFIAAEPLVDQGMVHVEFRDSGPGVAPETARRMFDPFFSTKAHGLGLDLAIARTLIEAQGGRLWLDPETGRGAAFHFTLPLAHE